MQYRTLGRTKLQVSVIGLGCGPVPALMTGPDTTRQRDVLARAIDVGINWIDTAAGYGDGQSETSIGHALQELSAQEKVHVATKVRLTDADLGNIEAAVRRSLAASLARLGLTQVTLLQLHNGITAKRGSIAASLSPDDVLGPGGVREALQRVRADGLVRHIGLTGTGEPEALSVVIDCGAFDTVQIPHHVLEPASPDVLRRCQAHDMGVFAIRVFAAGALLGHEPSAHTLKTPYFPLAVFERDRQRAAALTRWLGDTMSMKELAIRFALDEPPPHTALIGLSDAGQVDEVAKLATRGPLPCAWWERCRQEIAKQI